MKLSVYTGSLVDPAIGAHAVVNASNPSVALGSGVSGALREACGGTAFQQELRDRLEEDFDAELEPDECLVTSAGTSTAFRWVLHVPAVDYRKRDPETGGPSGPRRVRACVRAFLDAAASLATENDLTGQFIRTSSPCPDRDSPGSDRDTAGHGPSNAGDERRTSASG
ncbi:MAG: macro domain-containing protein [Polyangiaceae bacterium]|nr:macro domain-containing protein [Polyangiaceae bacterium]